MVNCSTDFSNIWWPVEMLSPRISVRYTLNSNRSTFCSESSHSSPWLVAVHPCKVQTVDQALVDICRVYCWNCPVSTVDSKKLRNYSLTHNN